MKKIYLRESQINKGLLLPKFLFNAIKAHQTSLGDNPAFPSGDVYPFDYSIIKERYADILTSAKDMGIDIGNVEAMKNEISELVKKCKELEKPIRDVLERICFNAVNKMFAVPEGAVNLKCKLVDKVKYGDSINVTPESSNGNDGYRFKDLDELDLSKKAIAKRRFIDALIMGAAKHFSSCKLFYVSDIPNPELIELYDRIMTINDVLLFQTEEKMKDDKPMQGSFVEVHIGGNGKKTDIEAQGVIFPLLLHDTIKGLFELFSVHGLPHDRKKAKYIISKSDFLLAEPWDMRFGVKLWDKIFGRIGDFKIVPFVFMNLISSDDFNKIMQEILSDTYAGEEIMKTAVEDAMHDSEYQEFKDKINQKNLDKSILSDSYFTASELDSFQLDNEDNVDVIEEDDLQELSHQTYQNASMTAFDNDNNDTRIRDFRKNAEMEFNKEENPYAIRNYDPYKDDENWIKLNNGKKLVIFDNEYKSLDDLVNGVKSGKLLIHARGMSGEISDDMRYIEPDFSETLRQFYQDEYDGIAQSKSEYYGEEIEPEYPELVFASDDFSWCKDDRNGVFFIESDGFQKSLGNGKIQLPNGKICKYWEGDVYDYDNELFRDEPICCEYGDWYSSNYATVVAVMNIA